MALWDCLVRTWDISKAVIALVGFLFYWIGGWTMFDVWTEAGAVRDLSYTAVGLLALAASETLYWNAGVPVRSCPAVVPWGPDDEPSMLQRLVYDTRLLLKLLLSMWGSMLCWLGLYSLVDVTLPPLSEPDGNTPQAYKKYVASVVLGYALLFGTGTLLSVSGIQDDDEVLAAAAAAANASRSVDAASLFVKMLRDDSPQVCDDASAPLWKRLAFHLGQSVRAVLSVLGQTLLGYGAYCICEVVPLPFGVEISEFWKNIFVSAVGLAMVLLCDSIVHPSQADLQKVAVVRRQSMREKPSPASVRWHLAMLYGRSLGVLTGSLILCTGMWVLGDRHINSDWATCSDDNTAAPGSELSCQDRNVLYVIFGMGLIFATHSVESYFGVNATFVRLLGFPAGVRRRIHLAKVEVHQELLELKVIRLMLPRRQSYQAQREHISSKIAAKRMLEHHRLVRARTGEPAGGEQPTNANLAG